MLGGGKVGHGLHHAEIRVEGGLGQILAVAGGGNGRHVQLGMALIQPQQHGFQQSNGVPLIGPVVGEQQLRVLVDDRHLHRGGA